MNHPTPDPQEEQLDSEISSIRAEIRTLQRHRRFLTSSLLSSSAIQKHLQRPSLPSTLDSTSVSPLVSAAGKHTETNHHRIAFGTTTFPFKDPSPTAAANTNLLGVRIDVCARKGRFAKPYYVLLRRERALGDTEKRLRVHRHTVPAFISMAKLESVYLPVPLSRRAEGEEDGDSDGNEEAPLKPSQTTVKGTRRQDLRGFVRELRRELVAWHVRSDAVELLREKLSILDSNSDSDSSTPWQDVLRVEGTGIVSITPTALEARYVRLEWVDGRVGRFKLSNAGLVERAVVIGDQGRDKRTEDAMTGGGGRVESILDRLKVCAVSGTA